MSVIILTLPHTYDTYMDALHSCRCTRFTDSREGVRRDRLCNLRLQRSTFRALHPRGRPSEGDPRQQSDDAGRPHRPEDSRSGSPRGSRVVPVLPVERGRRTLSRRRCARVLPRHHARGHFAVWDPTRLHAAQLHVHAILPSTAIPQCGDQLAR